MTERNPKDIAAQTKVPMHLLPAAGLIHGAMACREGAIKYGPYNWREHSISLMEYLGALQRHIAQLQSGEWSDRSGVPHLGHIIAGAAIVLDAEERQKLKHDIPGMPPFAMQKYTSAATCVMHDYGKQMAKDAAE